MALKVDFICNRENYTLNLEESNSTTSHTVGINGKNYKIAILGSSETPAMVRLFINNLEGQYFESMGAFKVALGSLDSSQERTALVYESRVIS